MCVCVCDTLCVCVCVCVGARCKNMNYQAPSRVPTCTHAPCRAARERETAGLIIAPGHALDTLFRARRYPSTPGCTKHTSDSTHVRQSQSRLRTAASESMRRSPLTEIISRSGARRRCPVASTTGFRGPSLMRGARGDTALSSDVRASARPWWSARTRPAQSERRATAQRAANARAWAQGTHHSM